MNMDTGLVCYCCSQGMTSSKSSDRGIIYLCTRIDEQEFDALAGKIKTPYQIDHTVNEYVCKKCTGSAKLDQMIGQLQMIALAFIITLVSIYFEIVVGVILVGLFFVASLIIFLFSIDGYSDSDARDYAVLNKYFELKGKPDELEYTCFARSNYFN